MRTQEIDPNPVYVRVDRDEVRELAAARQAAHINNSTPRKDPNDPTRENRLGVAAELAFEAMTGLPVDRNTYDGRGDGHRDFVFLLKGRRMLVDVKGPQFPKFLLAKEAEIAVRPRIDIFVLSGVDDARGLVTFWGWEHHSIMRDEPVENLNGAVGHCRARCLIRPIVQLVELIWRDPVNLTTSRK